MINKELRKLAVPVSITFSNTVVGDWEQVSKGGDWGERVRDACYKKPILFISVDVSVAVAHKRKVFPFVKQ